MRWLWQCDAGERSMSSPLAEAFAAALHADPMALVAWTPAGECDRRALDAMAARLASRLPAGARIAVSVRDPLRLLAAVLAVWRRDGCALLLDAADPQAPRLDLAAAHGASHVVTDALEPLPVSADGSAPLAAGRFAAIKLSSGSTGTPRAIACTSEALAADADQLERTMGIGDGDRVLAAVPMSFSYGVGNLLVPAIVRGRVLVLPADHGPGFLAALRDGRPTVLPAVPALLRALVQGARELPPSLRLVLSAGAPLAPAVARVFRERFGRAVHAFYGASEAGGICFDATGTAAELGAVGTPVRGVDVAIDDDGRIVVRSAAVGEALDGGDNPRGGCFRAPDLGAFRDGMLVLHGRVGEVFDVGGHKVHPREIEAVVAEMAGVEEVVVLPWRDGDGRATAAALVAATGVDELAVRRHCAARLPAAKVPRCVRVVAELPRTARGKLQREEIERLLTTAPPGSDES